MGKNLILFLISLLIFAGCTKSNNEITMEDTNQLHYKYRAKEDLKFIFDSLNSSKFTYNHGFSEQLNKDLEEVIVTDILIEKLEGGPKTQTVIRLSQQNEAIVKKSIFSKNIKVTITGIGDSYWIVGGEKSSIPGEVEKERIIENHEAQYILEYREIGRGFVLVNFEDDNGQYLGESRTWPGRRDLMEKYRENPSLIE